MYYSDIKQALKDSFKQVFTCYKDKQTGYEIWLTKWRDNKRFWSLKSSHNPNEFMVWIAAPYIILY